MTNSNNSAKKLYKVFVQKHNPDTEDELNCSATKLNISIDEAAHRVDVFMDVNRKTLKGAYKVFSKAIEQAVADGALDKKVAEFAYFADDINDIDFAGKDYFIANDNLNNSFAYGIDDNGDNGYYFWFWALTEAAEEIAEVEGNEETAEVNSNTKEEIKMTIETKKAKVAINAEGHNADVASGNYSLDINGEYVWFENHSIVRIDAMRKMNWIYDHTGANKIFRYGNRKSSAAKVIDMYMNGERADEQGKYFHEFFDQYCKTCGTIEVLVILTYADDREHHFMAEFNQGRLADKFIADVKELAGDTPCQIFKKYRDNHVKPVWEDPHKYETVGNLEHARHLYGEETSGDIDLIEEYLFCENERGNNYIKVKCVRTVINDDELLTYGGTVRLVRSNKYLAQMQYTNKGNVCYDTLTERGDVDHWCEEDFFTEMQERGACTIEPDEPEPVAMSDDISDICKYNPDLEDDDKSCRLDWDDSAIAHIPTGEEELAAFISPQIVIEQGYLEPAIIDNGKTYTESKYAAKVAAENYEPAFTTKTDKNGRTLYYLGGKRVSRDDYFWEYDRRSEMIDEMLDKRMDWFDKPEEIDGVITLDSGVERDEVADVKGIGDLADRYIEIDGATAQSVEVKLDGRRKRYYIDGKRASRDRALDVCAEMRGDNHFTIEYRRESKTISRFDVTISMNDDGFSVISGQTTIHTFEDIEDAEVCVNQIEAAYLSGWHGVKVDLDGTISDLDEAEELEALATKMEARILSSPAIAEKYARAKERVEVTFSKYGYPLYRYRKTSGEWTDNERAAKTYITKCGLSENDFIVKAKHDAEPVATPSNYYSAHISFYRPNPPKGCSQDALIVKEFDTAKDAADFIIDFAKSNKITATTIFAGDSDNAYDLTEADFNALYPSDNAPDAGNKVGDLDNDLTEAEKLTAKLKDVTRKSRLMDIYPQVGGRIVAPLYNVEIVPDGGGFIFTNGHETLARYDTKEQCLDVIEQIKTAVDFGDNEFTFPTAADVELELKLPALMIEQFNKYRYRSKGRSIPRRFLAAQLKYYGLTASDLRKYKTA